MKRLMGKLSRNLLSALLLPLAKGDSNFEVTSCNDDGALSLRILQSYFENNLSGQEDDFTLNNGYYERTIAGSDLQMEFDEEDDRKLASFYIKCLKKIFRDSIELHPYNKLTWIRCGPRYTH